MQEADDAGKPQIIGSKMTRFKMQIHTICIYKKATELRLMIIQQSTEKMRNKFS